MKIFLFVLVFRLTGSPMVEVDTRTLLSESECVDAGKIAMANRPGAYSRFECKRLEFEIERTKS